MLLCALSTPYDIKGVIVPFGEHGLWNVNTTQLQGERFTAWAPALGGQGGHVPTLAIIWVGIAYPEFPSLERVWVTTAHPGFCAKTVP